MRKLMIFIQKNCPYCKAALRGIEELQKEEIYQEIEITLIDELVESEYADTFDYFYVPTFYYQDRKIHEGAINDIELKQIFDNVISDV